MSTSLGHIQTQAPSQVAGMTTQVHFEAVPQLGEFCPPWDMWQCLDMFALVTLGKEGKSDADS